MDIYQQRYRHSEKGKIARKRYEYSEKCKVARKRYMQSEKGKMSYARGTHKRRMRINKVSTLTVGEWNQIKKQYHYRCVYCMQKKPLTIEHIIPLSLGGTHTKENIVPACQSCNTRRGIKPTLLIMLAQCDMQGHIPQEGQQGGMPPTKGAPPQGGLPPTEV